MNGIVESWGRILSGYTPRCQLKSPASARCGARGVMHTDPNTWAAASRSAR